MSLSPPFRFHRGFTLIELLVTIALIAVLFLAAFAGYKKFLERGDAIACSQNIKNLGSGFKAYILDHGTWPEEPGLRDENGDVSESEVWEFFYTALKDNGVSREDWFCPVEKRNAKKEDATLGEGEYEDPSYIPVGMLVENDPYQYATLPWLSERQDFHGTGRNLYMGVSGTVEKEVNFPALKTK